MFENVLLALEPGPKAYEVIECVEGLRVFGTRNFLLVQCLSLGAAVAAGYEQTLDLLVEELERLKDFLEEAGFSVETAKVAGSPHREINRLMKEKGSNLVIVGPQFDTQVGEILFGGVAADVIHHPPGPVLVVRPLVAGDPPEPCPAGVTCDFAPHILFPTDFSRNSEEAFRCVERMAPAVKRITLLHVHDRTAIEPHLKDRLEEFDAHDQERLRDLKDKLEKAGAAEVRTIIRYGVPTAELLTFLEQEEVSLVVMGSQGRGRIAEIFLGSLSHNLVRHSPVPVLLIPPMEEPV